ncbi:hypothetical protein F2Q69_00051529 [Brassica cretica]|uniref:Uncharacterized protein n=1 Tax=Brassica cretica TaxID=69181 RepID=A0A8S9PSY9_BRACR|nr:hypothetical protein F2Q69_00051529 [Brassica cretica]
MQVLRMLARIKHKPLRDEPTYKAMNIKDRIFLRKNLEACVEEVQPDEKTNNETRKGRRDGNVG